MTCSSAKPYHWRPGSLRGFSGHHLQPQVDDGTRQNLHMAKYNLISFCFYLCLYLLAQIDPRVPVKTWRVYAATHSLHAVEVISPTYVIELNHRSSLRGCSASRLDHKGSSCAPPSIIPNGASSGAKTLLGRTCVFHGTSPPALMWLQYLLHHLKYHHGSFESSY